MVTETWTLPLAPSVDSDQALVERHRRGDRAAFESIYASHKALVFSLCLRLAGDRELAQDLAQETFLRLHRHLGRFRGGSALSTWIYRVTLNVCRSRFGRRTLVVEPIETAFAGGEPAAAGPDPEQLAAAAEDGERLAQALSHLPLQFREAVVLRDVEGLGYEEIAGVLGVPIGTVRSRIARGRDALRLLLAGAR